METTATLRKATVDDVAKIQQLYHDTINLINIRDYNQAQVAAWSGRAKVADWAGKVTDQYFLVAIIDGLISGFASLTGDGHVDLLFVHHFYQGKGIAQQLMTALLKEAHIRGITRLTIDASKTARGFFERSGFIVVTEQTVIVDGVSLNNYKMERGLQA